MRTSNLLAGLALAFIVATQAAAGPRTLEAGAVAAPDRYGALAAQEVLKAGGNAVDAGVAVAFVLAVTYPEAGNLGGGGFMTLYVDGKPYFLDYRETAPGRASAGMYLDAKGRPIVEASLVGPLAAGVPGTVRGMAEAHRRFGKLSWAQDLAPAIRLARQGFSAPRDEISLRDANSRNFAKTNFNRYFGQMAAGRTFRQPELAATLERIAREGAKDFYEGRTAGLIVAQMGRGPGQGLISKTDLAGYKAVWRAPLEGEWRGFHLITAPPPSSGGIALLQLLAMKADDAALFKGVALNSAQYLHLISEIEKRVFADRAEYLGDPDFWRVPVAALTDPAYMARRAREADPAKPSVLASAKPGLGAEKPQTTHFSVVDRWGNAISNTYTLNGDYGSGVIVEGAGFLLNDEMDDFSVKPGAPNQFGVVGGDANAIAPFKRPLSSMTPTILTKDGNLAMVIGTPGGSRIFTSIFQVLADVYDFHLPLAKAMAALRFHHQLLPQNTIFTEPYASLPPALAAQVKARGYRVEKQGFNGDMEAVQVVGGLPQPASDPRARGVSLVVR
ncbi:gamma-glutamyltransferase [Phenylobacterium sp.]|uniref:gamma-glutamyltransferase n=1 Tax=Phenylobacterium sp. TaxID=1871053 RepID=UPI002C613643|nr:gamma-glutamyltransferase [Phenylobacterium sp.]HLZ75129.1 gamma-glutamyltransferase [Phenylobacterium sp.]